MNFRTFKLFHNLSLDVVLGAAGSYAFACHALFQPVSFYFATVLSISVWIIYLADHLLDSMKIPFSPKYELFSRHKPVLATAVLLLSALDLYLILSFLPSRFIHYGMILGSFLVLYLAGQHFIRGKSRHFFPKEILISLIYTIAVWLYPFLNAMHLEPASVFFLVLHFLLVTINVLIFSFFEKEEDARNQRLSFFSHLPENNFKRIISALCIASFLLALFTGLFFRFPMMILVPAFISVAYWLEISFSRNGKIKIAYPEITDGIFLLFLFYLV